MPEADRKLALSMTKEPADKKILARKNVRRCAHGLGKFSNHTCCETHCNSHLWLVSEVRTDEDVKEFEERTAPFAILRATQDISPGQNILTSYC